MYYAYYLLLPALILALYSQAKVKTTFAKYSKVGNSRGLTGYDVATQLLRANGITDVQVGAIRGSMTDHYDPRTKMIRLSETVYGSTSISAIAVAAHETGHAIQDNVGYTFLRVRHALYPISQFGSQLSMPLFFIGLIFSNSSLVNAGILLFSFAVLFQIVTLPVEFNASGRAINALEDNNLLEENEIEPAKKVLSAAALTYVAATAMALSQLIRLIAISNSRNND